METTDEKQLLVYPNPNQGNLNVVIEGTEGQDRTLEIFDVTGKRVLLQNSSDETTNLDIRHLASGTYTLRVTTAEYTYTRMIILE